MPTKFQMQACSSVDGTLHAWRSRTPDWSGAAFPGAGTALDVALACASLPTIGGVNAAGAAKLPVIIANGVGSIGTPVTTLYLKGYPESFGWYDPRHLAGISRKQFAAMALG